MARVTVSLCPNCGAPVNVPPGTLHAICVYCNRSLSVTRTQPGVPASLTPEGFSVADIETVKALLLDGKREEAITHYMRIGAMPRGEAEAAIDALVLSSHYELTKHLPLTARGMFLSFLTLLFCVGLVVLFVFLVPYASIFKVIIVFPIVVLVLRAFGFFRQATSTWTAAFGASGKGRIVRCGVVRKLEEDAHIAVVHFEVTPDDGSETFQDAETVFVGDETLEKLKTGNVIGVRFNRARQHVYMRTPVTVLASGT
ncbi:MAG: hypothetical protein KIT84_31270 [Labilithrix sp.]|nr:hypothetical protein [Labilithrix sp.]MCW5815550.1 hypothetical protein [Labilithrix sp.]